MSRVTNAIQAMARHELARRPICELGAVTSVFDGSEGEDAHTVSVTLKDLGVPLPRVPLAASLCGAAALPRVGDVVLVLFPRGDLGSAVVASVLYTDERRPPSFKKDEAVLSWPGDADDPDADAVVLRILADGSSRELTVSLGGDKDATLRVADGALKLVAGGVSILLQHSSSSDGEISVEAGGAKISLKQDGDVTVETRGKLTLKGAEVSIEGDTKVSVNGQTVEIN